MRPAILFIGAQKASNSSFCERLTAHLHVFAQVREELHYFKREVNYAKGIEHYTSRLAKAIWKGPRHPELTEAHA